MTFAEINRAIASKQRLLKIEAKERATYDYVLADLIGRSVARIYNSSNKMPEIHEVYPALFEAQEIQEQKATQKTKLSVARFKQFANSHNKRFNKEVANKQL